MTQKEETGARDGAPWPAHKNTLNDATVNPPTRPRNGTRLKGNGKAAKVKTARTKPATAKPKTAKPKTATADSQAGPTPAAQTAEADNVVLATIVTDIENPLSKTLELVAGKLKKSAEVTTTRGRFKTVEFRPREFGAVLQSLTMHDAMAYGTIPTLAPGEVLPLVTDPEWRKQGCPPDALPRTKEVVRWRDGHPGVLMCDRDEHGDGAMSRDDLVATTRAVCPGLASALMWGAYSASSMIWKAEANKLMTGVSGQRLYIVVADAAGRIVTVGAAITALMKSWGLDPALKTTTLRKGQRAYMQYHRGRLADIAAKKDWL